MSKTTPEEARQLAMRHLDGIWSGRQMTQLAALIDEVRATPPNATKGDEVSDAKLAVVLDVGFRYENGTQTPTVLVGFAIDDWESRDKFAAAIRAAQKG